MILKRGIGPKMKTVMSRGGFFILMANIDWPGEPVFAHTGVGPISWGGKIYQGVGVLGNIQIPDENSQIAASEAVMSLAGVSSDLEGYADDNPRNHTAEFYIACVEGRPGGHDGAQRSGLGNKLIDWPVRLFTGTMDGLTMTTSSTSEGVEESVQIAIKTGQEARSATSIFHSDEDQKRFFPTDTAGRLVIMALARAQKLQWPEP